MINFPTNPPVGSNTQSVKRAVKKRSYRHVVSSKSTDNKRYRSLERRQMKDRRQRGHGALIMDRRYNDERRRSSIDVTV